MGIIFFLFLLHLEDELLAADSVLSQGEPCTTVQPEPF